MIIGALKAFKNFRVESISLHVASLYGHLNNAFMDTGGYAVGGYFEIRRSLIPVSGMNV